MNSTSQQDCRQAHLGHLLGHAMRRFDERVLRIMVHNVYVPLALSNLAARAQVATLIKQYKIQQWSSSKPQLSQFSFFPAVDTVKAM